MITKHNARAIVESVLEEARTQEVKRKNATARPVSFMYRFPELDSIEPWERRIVVREAAKHATREKSFLIVWSLSSALALFLGYAVIFKHLVIPPPLVWLGAAAIFAPMYFYRRKIMRQFIRERAKLHFLQ